MLQTCKASAVSLLDPETNCGPAGDMQAIASDAIGAMSEAASLAFQLPEVPEDVERDLDRVSQAWLRIRRASQVLLQVPQSPPRFPANPWIPEGRPPTVQELQILEKFYTFVSEQELALDEVWDKLANRTGHVSLFALRNHLGLVGTKETTYVQKTGTIWPSSLPPAEMVYTAICVALRFNGADDRGIPKDRFILLRRWMGAEAQINKILNALEVDQTLYADVSGARLQAVMNMVAHHPDRIKSREDILKFVEIMLDLESRATTSCLLFNSGEGEKPFAGLLDMVLRQGLPCIANKSLLLLFRICNKVLDQLVQLGSPKGPMTLKDLMMGSSWPSSPTNPQVMAEIPLVRKEANSSMRRIKTIGDPMAENGIASSALSPVQSRPGTPTQSPTAKSELPFLELAKVSKPTTPTSMPTSLKSPKLPSLTASPANSGRKNADKFGIYLNEVATSGVVGDSEDGPKFSGRSKPSTPTEDEVPCKGDEPPGKKSLRQSRSTPVLQKKLVRASSAVHRLGSSTSLSSLSDAGSPARGGSGDKKNDSRRVERRSTRSRTIVVDRRRSIEGDPLSLTAAAKAVYKMTNAEWELTSCQLFWSTMPPQTITYAIGASLHSYGNCKLGREIIRPAWELLDKASVVVCTIGNIGTKRLRLEMDMLLDQFNRTLLFGKGNDTEELASFLNKVTITMVHLQRLSEANSKFAQVAVLYGIAFIAEIVCTWAAQTEGGSELATATRDLSRVLSPHLQQLFQRRLDFEADLP